MSSSLGIELAERFWANKSSFTHHSFRVVVVPGTSLHRIKLTTQRSEHVISVTMNSTLTGAAYAASRVSEPSGPFDLPGLSGLVNAPGWVGINSQGKPYYWLHVVLAESDSATVDVEGATMEEHSERVVSYDPSFKYVLTETSARGEWIADLAYFGSGNMAELVRKTVGATQGVNQMPWLSIIMALLSFFVSKKSGASNTKAAITAGLVGAGTYYVSHETDWGRANLGDLDGVVPDGDGVVIGTGNAPVTDADGKPIVTGGNAGGTSFTDILRGWGATGTAAVIGAGAAATGSGVFSSKNLPWLIGGAVLLLVILKD